ncbi:MAG TPA: hypothetical protein VGS57_06195 [Thermoanaerobaculia bacterium]|nr:hypothetical protein [Thermoanaerobaculia bacterium]
MLADREARQDLLIAAQETLGQSRRAPRHRPGATPSPPTPFGTGR